MAEMINWKGLTYGQYADLDREFRIYGKRDHGLVDNKGRRIGGHVEMRLEILIVKRYMVPVEGKPNHKSGVVDVTQTGKRTTTTVTTRDGKRFGAIARSTTHDTIAAAKKYAEKALASQAKRYAKKFPQGPVPAPEPEPDAECIMCAERFWSAEGHPTMPICAGCQEAA